MKGPALCRWACVRQSQRKIWSNPQHRRKSCVCTRLRGLDSRCSCDTLCPQQELHQPTGVQPILRITATITEALLLLVTFFTTPPHPPASQQRLLPTLPPFPPLGHLCMHLNTTGLTEVLKCKVHDTTPQSLSDRAHEPRNTEPL